MTAHLNALRTAAVSLVSLAACSVALAVPLAMAGAQPAATFEVVLSEALATPTAAGNVVSPRAVIESAMARRLIGMVP